MHFNCIPQASRRLVIIPGIEVLEEPGPSRQVLMAPKRKKAAAEGEAAVAMTPGGESEGWEKGKANQNRIGDL